MERILVVDDEPGIRSVLSDILEDENYKVFSAEDGFEGLSIMRTEPIDLVILDVWLPNMGGIDVLKEIKKDYPDTQVIIISGHANIDIAVKAVKLGAYDFLEKPLSLEKTINLVRNALALEQLKKENRNLRKTLFVEDEMIGAGAQMRKVRELISQSSESDVRILILGDNGTGKELVAREIHRQSRRSEAPFVEVNCAAIPDTLIESELFGHEKGAFTNALNRKKGKFELADGGTLFLDEIADMSLSAQAKVLRAVQESKFERVGGEETLSVDVRIVAATNKTVEEEIRKGRFREDLYFRLNVLPIRVPSLRERMEDLPELVAYFMNKYGKKTGGENRRFSPEAMKILAGYSWPGNIRELKNFIERINIMSDETVISTTSVKDYLNRKVEAPSDGVSAEYADLKLNDAKDSFEKAFLERKLQENGFNISRTAEALGIYPSNLHSKIKKFGIKTDK